MKKRLVGRTSHPTYPLKTATARESDSLSLKNERDTRIERKRKNAGKRVVGGACDVCGSRRRTERRAVVRLELRDGGSAGGRVR